MNIAAYCRVSTDKEDQLNSLATQKQYFQEYAQKNGHNLVQLYADEGISGTKTKNRHEFLRMIRDAQRGQFEQVVVKDISRLARNTVDLLENTRKLKALGIGILFLTANMTTLGDSEFVLTMFGALAQEESANTSKRIKFGKRSNAEKGRVPNLVFGYDKIIGEYFSLAVNEQEAATVRQIFTWYLDEGYGASRISAQLNAQGVLTKRGCRWVQNSVCRVLKNELYAGFVINGKQEVTDFLTGHRKVCDEDDWLVTQRPDLCIIPPERFAQAAEQLKARGQDFRANQVRQSSRHLFSTVIRCKECGRSFTRITRQYKNTMVRWVCNKHLVKDVEQCPNRITVDEGALIQELQAYFQALLADQKDTLQRAVRMFNQTYRDTNESAAQEAELKRQHTQIEAKRKKFQEMFVNDIISVDELRQNTDGLRAELGRIEKQLALLKQHMTRGDQLEQLMRETFAELSNLTDVRNMTNAQLKRIVERIEVDAEGRVSVHLRLLSELGLQQTVPIRNACT